MKKIPCKIKNVQEEIIIHRKSIGKAAEEFCMSKWEILDLVKQRNIDWTNYRKKDLKKDLLIIYPK